MWRLRISWPGEPHTFEDYYNLLEGAKHAAETIAGEGLHFEDHVEVYMESYATDAAGQKYKIEYADKGE